MGNSALHPGDEEKRRTVKVGCSAASSPLLKFNIGVHALGITRHGRPNAIAKSEADDHADHKLYFLVSCAAKRKGQAMVINPALTTAYPGEDMGDAGLMISWLFFRFAAFKKDKRL